MVVPIAKFPADDQPMTSPMTNPMTNPKDRRFHWVDFEPGFIRSSCSMYTR
jgi:hypothetical protein